MDEKCLFWFSTDNCFYLKYYEGGLIFILRRSRCGRDGVYGECVNCEGDRRMGCTMTVVGDIVQGSKRAACGFQGSRV